MKTLKRAGWAIIRAGVGAFQIQEANGRVLDSVFLSRESASDFARALFGTAPNGRLEGSSSRGEDLSSFDPREWSRVMPKMLSDTRAKKLASRFIAEKCTGAIIAAKLSYIGFTTDIDDSGVVRVLAYGHKKGDPQDVTFVAVKDRAVLLAVLKNEVPAGYGEKDSDEAVPAAVPPKPSAAPSRKR